MSMPIEKTEQYMVSAEVIPKTDAKIAILRRLNLNPAIPDQIRSTATIKIVKPPNDTAVYSIKILKYS